jgi:hypothetical protein
MAAITGKDFPLKTSSRRSFGGFSVGRAERPEPRPVRYF